MDISAPSLRTSDKVFEEDSARLDLYGRLARLVVLLLMAYWLVYDLVAPVISVDAHNYNLARLELALRGGFFNNPQWTSLYQVCYPWSFDAVHLPMLLLGWGAALPSYLCLVGTLVVVWRMVREKLGPNAAWLAALSLLSLFTVVQQASSTKTDLAILFMVSVWVYARAAYKRDGRLHHLIMMSLALGFMSGAKVFGLCFGFVLGLLTLWILRHDLKRLWLFVLSCVVTLLLWGSTETYIESMRLYNYPLGPPILVAHGGNVDGVRGAAANFTRYSAGLVYAGPISYPWARRNALVITEQTKAFLRFTGLLDKGGVRSYSDAGFAVLHLPHEEYCGYGPVGTFSLIAMVLTITFWRPKELWWQAGALGLGLMLLLCFLLGYDNWNSRYLITSIAACTLSFVLFVWVYSPARLAAYARWFLLVFLAVVGVAAPFLSLTKRPVDIVSALVDRRRFECVNMPASFEILESLRRGHRLTPDSKAYVIVNKMSPVLLFLEEREFRITPLSASEFNRRRAEGWVLPGDLVAEDFDSGVQGLIPMEKLSVTNPFAPFGPPLVRKVYRVGPLSQP